MTNSEPETPTNDPDPKAVWKELCVLHDEHPTDLMHRAVACGRALVPHLIATLEDADADPQKYIDGEMADAPVYALLLLAKFRTKEAFPRIIKFFCRDDDLIEDLVGDGLTEYLPALLASTFDGNIGALVELALDTEVNEFVSSSAVIAIGSITVAGMIDRKAAITALIEIGQNLPRKAPGHWADLAVLSARLRAQDLYPMIDRAFVEGKIPKNEFTRADFEKLKKTEFKREDDHEFRLIDDVVQETSWWSVFHDDDAEENFDVDDFEDGDDDHDHDHGAESAAPGDDAPFTHADKKVGRNDLCPCGSGRKYKKCCGS